MWLRDSQNQVVPYMRFAKSEPDGIGLFLRGLIRRHVDSVLLDPYANSFSLDAENQFCNIDRWKDDVTTKIDPKTGARVHGGSVGVFQRKWEMDSLASVLRLGRTYWEATSDPRPFDARWQDAVRAIHDTFRAMQQPLTPNNYTLINYTYQRSSTEPKDTSAHGIGRFHRWTGMVRTSFLPSDDSPRFPYHIPGNAFAVVELRGAAEMLRELPASQEKGSASSAATLAAQLEALAAEVDRAIQQWGIIHHSQTGERVYAMEVDGFGNAFFADDANVPSLLSLPYLGYVNNASTDPIYQATRRLLLDNTSNPYYYGPSDVSADFVGGIGSEDASGNAGLGRVWPLSLTMRLLTGASDDEARAVLRTLKLSSGGTGLVHESYWFEDPTQYTRFWFAMANSHFGEAILSLAEQRPHLLFADA